MRKPTRREMLEIGAVAAAAGAGVAINGIARGATPEPTSSLGQHEAAIDDKDRRFRFVFNRALVRLRMRRKIARQQFRDFRAASFNVFEYERGGKLGAFIQHVQRDINKASSGAFEDMLTAAQAFADAVIRWLVEMWDSILEDIIGNFKALQLAVDSDEE